MKPDREECSDGSLMNARSPPPLFIICFVTEDNQTVAQDVAHL